MKQLPELSNFQIEEYFAGHPAFLGCFAKDDIPSKLAGKTGCIVINMDSKSGGGTHWIVLLLNKYESVYVDSFGMTPSENVLTFMRRCAKPMFFSDIQLQDLKSSSCGWFCICIGRECAVKGRDILDVLFKTFGKTPQHSERALLKYFQAN